MPVWMNNLNTAPIPEKPLQKLAEEAGMSLHETKDGDYVAQPKHLGSSRLDQGNFYNAWLSTMKDTGLASRISSIDTLDRAMPEVNLVVDTYTDEILQISSGESNVSLVEIKVFKGETLSKDLTKKINAIIDRNGITTSKLSAITRQLVKYGDTAVRVLRPEGTTKANAVNKMILKVLKVKDKWEVLDHNEGDVSTYKLSEGGGTVCNFWDLVQFSVVDEDTSPYGKSAVIGMVPAADQLLILEALLAITRASKVDRLKVTVPNTIGDNPTSALANIEMLKSSVRSAVFGSGGDAQSVGKSQSLQEVLFTTEGIDIDRISSNSAYIGTDDVEYFYDKIVTSSRMAKGFFSHDDTIERGNALATMDKKFARALVPYKEALSYGLSKLCYVLLAHLEEDVTKCKVTVSLRDNSLSSEEIMESYGRISETATELLTKLEDFDPDLEYPKHLVLEMHEALGLPANLIEIMRQILYRDTAEPAEDEESALITDAMKKNKDTIAEQLDLTRTIETNMYATEHFGVLTDALLDKSKSWK